MKDFEGRGDIPYNRAADKRKPSYRIAIGEAERLITGQPTVLLKDTKLETTINAIKGITRQFEQSVKPLAARLYTGNKEQDIYHVWNWIKTNIRYRLDQRGTEQIRNPKASYLEKFAGVDCEDYSIFCVCLLRQMNYKPDFVIVAFNNKPNFGHIYAQCEGYSLDCVLGQFDQKPPNVTKSQIIKL